MGRGRVTWMSMYYVRETRIRSGCHLLVHLNVLNFSSNDICGMSKIVPAFLSFRTVFIEILAIKAYCKINSCYFSAHPMEWLAISLR